MTKRPLSPVTIATPAVRDWIDQKFRNGVPVPQIASALKGVWGVTASADDVAKALRGRI